MDFNGFYWLWDCVMRRCAGSRLLSDSDKILAFLFSCSSLVRALIIWQNAVSTESANELFIHSALKALLENRTGFWIQYWPDRFSGIFINIFGIQSHSLHYSFWMLFFILMALNFCHFVKDLTVVSLSVQNCSFNIFKTMPNYIFRKCFIFNG